MSVTGQIAVLLAAAVIAIPLFRRFNLSAVLGYLAAGVVIGPWGLGLFTDVESILHFSELGVVLLLFVIGLELQPSRLWAMRKAIFGMGAAQVAITMIALVAALRLLGQPWPAAIVIGFALSLSSTALVLQLLAERGELNTRHGRSAFAILLFQDLAVMPALVLLPLLAGGGTGQLDWKSLTLGAVVVLAVVGLGRYILRPALRVVASTKVKEAFTAAALLVVVGTALLFDSLGLSMALGAFLAGVLLADSEYRHELEADIEPFKGLLLGLFFITVGAGIEFALARTIWMSVVFWAAVTIIAKIAVLLTIGWLYGLRRQALWLFSLSLPQAGEFAFVLIAFAVGNAVFEQAFADQLLLVVSLTMLMTPLLFILYDKLIAHIYCADQAPDEADQIDEENPIIIAGRGRVGGIVDRMLDAAGHRATVIDNNSQHLENMKKFGVTTYYGDVTRPDLLASAGIDRARILVVALEDREQIDKLVRYACSTFPNLHVISRAKDRDHVYHLWAMGCRDVIRETYDGALRMGRSVYEALGHDRQTAMAMTAAWEEMDRSSTQAIAEVYRLDVPAYENEELLAKIRELKAEWDPKLRDAMDEITARKS